MAQIDDRKGSFYSQKQSVRDELSAPQYLESAGDILIKNLAKKQTNKSTTLQEQLQIVQNFEKGFELNPEIQKGIQTLQNFKSHIQKNEEGSSLKVEVQNIDEFKKLTGLSRRELELSLCEKPNSAKAQLYKFAISSRRQTQKSDLASQLPDHPINKLKEIEAECFGHLSKDRVEANITESQNLKEEVKACRKRKRGKRKRKKEGNGESTKKTQPRCFHLIETDKEENPQEASSSRRPSLWDVKDMKKWSEMKKIGCAPRTYYMLKDGKIVKLENDQT